MDRGSNVGPAAKWVISGALKPRDSFWRHWFQSRVLSNLTKQDWIRCVTSFKCILHPRNKNLAKSPDNWPLVLLSHTHCWEVRETAENICLSIFQFHSFDFPAHSVSKFQSTFIILQHPWSTLTALALSTQLLLYYGQYILDTVYIMFVLCTLLASV